MHLRPFSFAAFILAAAALSTSARPAHAAGEKDKEALKLHDQAMDEDYLAVEFDKAEKKLKDALKKCGDDGCTPKVLGKLHVALGTVYGGSNKMDQAKEEFALALKADPGAALIESLTTPELSKAFEEAKKSAKPAGGGKPPVKPPPSGGGEEEENGGETGGGSKKPGGDLEHSPIAEQAVNTPVPVFIEIPEDISATKVSLKYKPFGATKWKTLEMNRVGNGWGAEIPCDDVTTTGDVKYYIVVTDDGGEQLKAGSQKEPYRVPIKREIEGDEPSLPGKKPPQQCAAKEDCPPGLPGCEAKSKKQSGEKGWGATCEADAECQEGLFCSGDGTCQEGKRGDDGGDDNKKSSGGKKNIIGVWGQMDLMLINSADNVCSGANEAYYCFYPGGSEQFYGEPIAASGTNGIQGGFALAGARALVSYDRELWKGKGALGVGARFGIAFGGQPSSSAAPPNELHLQAPSFPPIHGELRVWYSFLGSMVEHQKVRPYAFLGGGLGKVSSSVPVSVCDQRQKNGTDPIDAADDDCPGKENAKRRDLDAYQITGLNFIEVGGGVTYAFTPNIGIGAELKVMFMLPTFGVVFAPNIGPVFAF